jgi:hypothetical protein
VERDDGGPAFPLRGPLGDIIASGLTKREWFAGMILAHLNLDVNPFAAATNENTTKEQQNIARQIYQMADAMISERQKGA